MQIGIVVLAILLALGVYALSTVLHELSHMLACKMLHCKVVGWKILFIWHDGQKTVFNIKRKNHCAFVTDNVKKMRVIVAVGPMVDFLIAVICIFVALASKQSWCTYGLFGAASLIFLSVVYNLLPMTNGDGKMLFRKGGA